MKYHITELIAEWDKDNHKKIVSKLVDRKNHTFTSLKDLAEFTRSHYIFTSYQKEITEVPRNNEAGMELYLGNNLLWIDLDFEVNLKTLKKKLENLDLKCFAYYSSSYYNNSKANARLCIVCKEILDIEEWSQVNFYANQILDKLKLKQKEKPDKAIYNFSSYLAKVKGDYEEDDLIVIDGLPYKWFIQEKFINKINNATSKKEKEEISQKAGFGKSGDLAAFLNKLKSIEKAIARSKGTVSLSFTNIHEKTKLGYYVNSLDPWFVYHPKKDFQYLSNLISHDDFEKFKEFYLNFNNTIDDPFSNSLKPDKIINKEFINQSLFSDNPLIFLESSTGSGKTTAIADFIVKNPTKSVLFISVNRMQAIALYKALRKEGIGITCYLKDSLKKYAAAKKGRKKVSIYNEEFEEEAKSYTLPQRLICGVISLHHLIDDTNTLKKKYDYVIVDEVTTLPNSISNSVEIVHERLNTFEKGLISFKKLLLESDKVICMDGFVSNSVIDLIIDLSKKEPYIIKNTLPTNKKVEIYVCSGNQPKFDGKGTCKKYLARIMNDIESASFGLTKKLMVVALSSLDLSNKLGDLLQKKYPNKVIQIFNSEVTEKDGLLAIQMFEDLDKYLEDNMIDILIYSPSITTGIDIPQAKGTNVYQIISGDQLSSHINYQMTMRGRNASFYRVLITRSLMVDKKTKTFKDYIKDSIQYLKDTIPFKAPKSIKWKARNFQTNGFLLAYNLLEYNISEEEWKKIIDLKTLITSLKTISKKYYYNLEGVKIALKIDKAHINFQKELYLEGKTGYKQFINFLKHEKCRITIEEDIYKNISDDNEEENKEEVDYTENYIEDYSNKLKEIGLWKEEYKDLKYTRLFDILKMAKAFNILKEKIKIGEYNNEELIGLYDTIYKKSFLKDYKEFKPFLNKNTNKEKIAIVKSILSIIFNVDKTKRYSISLENISN